MWWYVYVCLFRPGRFEGRDWFLFTLTSHVSNSVSSNSINFCWIMNETERTLCLLKVNYMSISFLFLIADLGTKFTSTFFKYYCIGYMEVANSFGVQVLCGVNTFFCLCGVIFLGSIFFRYFKKITCNYSNYSPKIGLCVFQEFQIRFLVIFFLF